MIYIYKSLEKMRSQGIDPQELFGRKKYMSMIAHTIMGKKIHCKTDGDDDDEKSGRAKLLEKLFGSDDDKSDDSRRTKSGNDNDTWYNGDGTATHQG